jgi:putative ABC transport system substrate-binding protein
MNRRRKLIGALCASSLVAPFASLAQQQGGKIWRIGVLGDTPGPHWEAFQQSLRDLRYVEGRNIIIERRYAQGVIARFSDLAAELVRLRVDVIVTEGGAATQAAKKATSTIPIVMTIVGDPVGSGLVASLARPGGNISGSASLSFELTAKQLELLKETLPALTKVAFLWNPAEPFHQMALKSVEAAARRLRVQLHIVGMQESNQLDGAFAAVTKDRPDALLVLPTTRLDALQIRLAELTIQSRLPALYNKSAFAEAGGLMAYGARYLDFFQRAAAYVDKILKGANPGDLPVEQPTRFELVVNAKTAKALGIKIPNSILVRADKVIE